MVAAELVLIAETQYVPRFKVELVVEEILRVMLVVLELMVSVEAVVVLDIAVTGKLLDLVEMAL
jgi:hypothetical protein